MRTEFIYLFACLFVLYLALKYSRPLPNFSSAHGGVGLTKQCGRKATIFQRNEVRSVALVCWDLGFWALRVLGSWSC